MNRPANENEIAALIGQLFPNQVSLPEAPGWFQPEAPARLSEAHALVADADLASAERIESRLEQMGTRLRQRIASEVAIVRRLQPDSLAVVVSVIPRTRLFLRLTRQGDQIQAFARCEQGETHLLELIWPELQEVFRADGVLLLGLTSSDDGSSHTAGKPATTLPPQPRPGAAEALPELAQPVPA